MPLSPHPTLTRDRQTVSFQFQKKLNGYSVADLVTWLLIFRFHNLSDRTSYETAIKNGWSFIMVST